MVDSESKVPVVDEALEKALGENFTKKLYQSVTACTRATQGLPDGHEYSVQTALPHVSDRVDRVANKTLSLLHKILAVADDQFSTRRATPQSLAHKYDIFEDAIDNITDTIDENLKGDVPKQSHMEAAISKHLDRVTKPQRAWKSRIDNHRPRYIPVDLPRKYLQNFKNTNTKKNKTQKKKQLKSQNMNAIIVFVDCLY